MISSLAETSIRRRSRRGERCGAPRNAANGERRVARRSLHERGEVVELGRVRRRGTRVGAPVGASVRVLVLLPQRGHGRAPFVHAPAELARHEAYCRALAAPRRAHHEQNARCRGKSPRRVPTREPLAKDVQLLLRHHDRGLGRGGVFCRPQLEGRVARRTERPRLRARSRRRGRHRFRVAQIHRNVRRSRGGVRAAQEVHDVTRARRRGRSLLTRTAPLGGRAARPPRRRHDGYPRLARGRL